MVTKQDPIGTLIRRLPKLARQKGPITAEEAEALIADDDRLFTAVALYTADNPNIFEEWPEERRKFVETLKRIKPWRPWFKVFYRGQPAPCEPGLLALERGFRSWTSNRKIAEDFARDYPDGIVCILSGRVRGVSITDIATWRMRLRDESQYPGMQAEYLILEDHESLER